MKNDAERKAERDRIDRLRSHVARTRRLIEQLTEAINETDTVINEQAQALSTEEAITGELPRRLAQPRGMYAADQR